MAETIDKAMGWLILKNMNENISKELKKYLSVIGKRGGETLYKRRGKEYMAEIGKKGGRISRRGKKKNELKSGGLTNKKLK